jgi:hypothetical protein
MAAISRVFSIRRVAQMLGRDEDLLWELADQFEPEDGKIWVYDADEVETLAFTWACIERLQEIIADQVDQRGFERPGL